AGARRAGSRAAGAGRGTAGGLAGTPRAALPARRAVPGALPRRVAPPQGLRSRRGNGRDVEDRAARRLPRAAGAAARGRGRARAGRAVRADPRQESRGGEERGMDRPLRLITTSPVDRLARTVEALLVVASQPLSVDELSEPANDASERIETALRLLSERYTEGRSGIVLEHVAGGWAFRASREAAEACARLYERPVERGLSQAALEVVAIVAYLGPCSRPEIARIRGVNVDGVVAGLAERGLVTEAGREDAWGAMRSRTPPLFERVFGLESLSELPRVDDLGADTAEIRERLEAVAAQRPA